MIIIKVTHKLMLRDGSYIAKIENNKITTIFKKVSPAKSTSIAMTTNKIQHEYDGKFTIIQKVKGSEKELFEIVKGELNSAIKNKYPTQKLNYDVIQ